MVRFHRALLVAGLLGAPAVAAAQAPGRASLGGPDVAPAGGAEAAPFYVAPTGVVSVGPGCPPGGCGPAGPEPDHTYLPDDYVVPDYAWFPRPRKYRFDGRYRKDIDLITVGSSRPNGVPDEEQYGLRFGYQYWLDKDQRFGLQTNCYAAFGLVSEIEEALRIMTDGVSGFQPVTQIVPVAVPNPENPANIPAYRALNGRVLVSPSAVFNAECLLRCLVCRSDCFRLDVLFGARFFNVTSCVAALDTTPRGGATGVPLASLPAGYERIDQQQTVFLNGPGTPVGGGATRQFIDFQKRGATTTWFGPEVGLGGEYWLGRFWFEGDVRLGYGCVLGAGYAVQFVVNDRTPAGDPRNTPPTTGTGSVSTATLTEVENSGLGEVNVGVGFMVCRHIAVRAAYTYTRIGNVLLADTVPAFRSYNQHLVSGGITFRY